MRTSWFHDVAARNGAVGLHDSDEMLSLGG
jgi:hypothetical protein